MEWLWLLWHITFCWSRSCSQSAAVRDTWTVLISTNRLQAAGGTKRAARSLEKAAFTSLTRTHIDFYRSIYDLTFKTFSWLLNGNLRIKSDRSVFVEERGNLASCERFCRVAFARNLRASVNAGAGWKVTHGKFPFVFLLHAYSIVL